MDRFTQNDPERQANIAFALIFLGIIAVGALTIWLCYGASFSQRSSEPAHVRKGVQKLS